MNKTLIKNKTEFDGFIESVHIEDRWKLINYPPKSYPCIIVFDWHEHANGRDWQVFEIVCLDDFEN